MQQRRSLLSGRFRADGTPCIHLESDTLKHLGDFTDELRRGSISMMQHARCPLCGAVSGWLIGEKDRLGVPCSTVVCDGCGLALNDSFLDVESSTRFYREYWRILQWGGDSGHTFRVRTRPGAYAWKRFAYIALHLGEHFAGIRQVVEPGCGDGCNLLPFHLSGRKVLGADYDEESLEAGRGAGMDLMRGDAESLSRSAGSADLVLLSHVVEHFSNIDKELVHVRDLVTPGGYVYVEVPGLRNMNRPRACALSEDGYRSTNDVLSYLQFQHNYHFELATLKAFFVRNGFECISGDEWVRALFVYRPRGDTVPPAQNGAPAGGVIEYLRAVEADYRSVRDRVLRGGKHLLRRFRY